MPPSGGDILTAFSKPIAAYHRSINRMATLKNRFRRRAAIYERFVLKWQQQCHFCDTRMSVTFCDSLVSLQLDPLHVI